MAENCLAWSNQYVHCLQATCRVICQRIPLNDGTFPLQMYNSSTGGKAKADWFLLPSVPFYNRKLSMSILSEPLASARIQFSAHIFKTPRNYKREEKGRKSQGPNKKKKATQIVLRWLWRSRGLRRREACFYCALEIHLHQGGSAVWPLMELAEEEPHAPSVLHDGFTESHDCSLLITTAAIPVFQNP